MGLQTPFERSRLATWFDSVTGIRISDDDVGKLFGNPKTTLERVVRKIYEIESLQYV